MISSKDVVKAYNNGASIEEIADKYHLNPDSVHMALGQQCCNVESTKAEQTIIDARTAKEDRTTQRAIAWITHKGYDQDSSTLNTLVRVISLIDSKANYRDVMALGIDELKSIQQVAKFKKSLKEFES